LRKKVRDDDTDDDGNDKLIDFHKRYDALVMGKDKGFNFGLKAISHRL